MKTDTEIEQMLMRGKKLSLNTDEKDSIKSTLLAHARESLRHETERVASPWISWVLRGSVSFASLLLIFVGTAYAAQDSLPGEPLYAVKVHVVEEMVALTKIDPNERAAYDLSLMETRLEELQTLVEQNTETAPTDLTVVTDQINEHVADITATLDATPVDAMPHMDKVETLTKLSGITKAQAKISGQTDALSSVTDSLQDTQEVTTDALIESVNDFTHSQSAEAVNEYLGEQINTVSDQLVASSTEVEVRDTAEQHLHDVDESLIDGNTTDAIISVLEAQQVIMVDAYLGDSATAEDTESPTN